jgi:2-hydroxy-3-keto-5-methylthiopentenyl-1-phosphate phosphatase
VSAAPWAVVCDFDGTLTTEDVGDLVSIHFGGREAWVAAEDAYRAGAFPFSELLRRIFAPVTASADEIAAFARATAVLRHGAERFVAACREAGRPFVIASAGLDVYIEPVLGRLHPHLRSYLQLRSNRARCRPTGLEVDFHATVGGCGRCGFCKGAVVEELRGAGYRVAVLGDGSADRCAAEAADLVFARRSLARYCEERGIPHHRFDTFDDVIGRF